MSEKKQLTASLEDYLEAIYEISQKRRVARSRDIVKRMGVNGSSVTGALKVLAGQELIDYEPYGFVTLTDSGKRCFRLT